MVGAGVGLAPELNGVDESDGVSSSPTAFGAGDVIAEPAGSPKLNEVAATPFMKTGDAFFANAGAKAGAASGELSTGSDAEGLENENAGFALEAPPNVNAPAAAGCLASAPAGASRIFGDCGLGVAPPADLAAGFCRRDRDFPPARLFRAAATGRAESPRTTPAEKPDSVATASAFSAGVASGGGVKVQNSWNSSCSSSTQTPATLVSTKSSSSSRASASPSASSTSSGLKLSEHVTISCTSRLSDQASPIAIRPSNDRTSSPTSSQTRPGAAASAPCNSSAVVAR